jgi:hypothetical protein
LDEQPFGDIFVEVEAELITGPAYSEQGLLFRKVDGSNFSYFHVSRRVSTDGVVWWAMLME